MKFITVILICRHCLLHAMKKVWQLLARLLTREAVFIRCVKHARKKIVVCFSVFLRANSFGTCLTWLKIMHDA
jgi:hypothetical protein